MKTASAAQGFGALPVQQPAAPVVVPQPGGGGGVPTGPTPDELAAPQKAATETQAPEGTDGLECRQGRAASGLRHGRADDRRAEQGPPKRYGAHHIGVSKKYRKGRRLLGDLHRLQGEAEGQGRPRRAASRNSWS